MDSSQGVYMDTEAVRGMATKFGKIGDVLRVAGKALEALANVLESSAFMGRIGRAARQISIIEELRPKLETLAEKCEELNKDLDVSVKAYEQGDELGATRFH